MKRRIAIVADMRNWAWARKSEQLARHLGDEFDLQVVHLLDRNPDQLPTNIDLYSTFEIFMVHHLRPGAPYVTGMTAHVWDGHVKKHGEVRVRAWCDGAAVFHANSRLLEQEMAARLQRPIAYVPNGVDESFFRRTRPRRNSSRLVVGWVGKPNPRKGSDIVKRACAAAGVELRTVEKTHRDALPPEQMREFYQDLHVLVVASDMDGTPNPALEAAACGVAIVSNRIGNMPEMLVDGINGRLVERNAESIADALREIDAPTAIRMGEAARNSIEREWTWAKQSRNYAAMWTSCLSGGQAMAVAR